MSLRLTNVAAVLFVLCALTTPLAAQPVPGFLEGPLTEVDPIARTARVNGVLMQIPAGIPIESPTVDLNELATTQGVDVLALIVSGSLPGRAGNGFEGGTCLCETEVDLATGAHTAVGMVLEPAENVVIGAITEHNCVTASCDPTDNPANVLRLSGTALDFNNDARILSEPPGNRGFLIDLVASPSLVGTAADGEGYYGEAIAPFTERHLHYYAVNIDGGILVNAGVAEVSVLRAQCRQRNGTADYGIQGATHDPNTGTVTLLRADTLAVLGTADVIPDADNTAFGAYDFAGTLNDTCADTVRVEFGTAFTEAPVDVRIDDPAPGDPPPPPPTGGALDVITILTASWRGDKDQLDVEGSLALGTGNSDPGFVSIFAPGSVNGTGDGCDGTFAGNELLVPVTTSTFDFDFRDRGGFPVNPGTVCISSPNGGAVEGAVVID